MRLRISLAIILFSSLTLTFSPGGASAQDQGLVARWSFDEAATPVTRDTMSGVEDKVEGFYKYVPGVTGTGLRFDGYTTQVIRAGEKAPHLPEAFSVEAWVALNTLPWNWLPIVDHEQFQQVGYSFGIDAFGHLGLQVSVKGVWQSLYSTAQLPQKKWAHVVGTFDSTRGLAVYLNGKEVGRLPVEGSMKAAERVDLLIGRTREAALPVPAEAIHPFYPVWYSLDGILDEVKIYSRSLSPEEVQKSFAEVLAPTGEVLPWPVLPSGPAGAGRFGAYYATLKFEDVWDRPRRMGSESDVVVRFDQSPMRLVFWQGTNYVPAWVTENGKWYSDEFLETWGPGCPDGEDCEPMSDKQSVYSHASILESSDARVVVHWRYALAEVEHHKGAHADPLTGWFDWADEYWTVYPDGVAVRKQVIHTTDLSKPFEWQETIVINGPGQKPEDNINLDALTLLNMKGESATYIWKPKPTMSFARPNGPETIDGPQDANIQVVNLKSTWKPFQIVPPANVKWEIYNGEKTHFTFECWNHWPVAQIPSSGRPCVASDRPSHSSLSHIYWDAYQASENTMSKLLLDGLTAKPPQELVPLAESWLSPPEIDVAGEGIRSEGYDAAERAFVLVREAPSMPLAADFTIQAREGSPAFNPAIVIKDWGDGEAHMTLDGKPMRAGKDLRFGHVQRLEGTDLVVWIQTQAVKPLRIRLTAAGER
jgi:hypothetical protein